MMAYVLRCFQLFQNVHCCTVLKKWLLCFSIQHCECFLALCKPCSFSGLNFLSDTLYFFEGMFNLKFSRLFSKISAGSVMI